MQTYTFTLQCVTSILMHANNIEARDRIEAQRKKMKGGKAGDDRSPPDSWKGYLYVSDETGNICMPTENLLSCLLIGGMKTKVAKMETLKAHSQRIMFDRLDYDLHVAGRTISMTDIEAIKGEFSEHAAAVRQLGFRLHTKPCTVGTAKHVRVRPMFGSWSIAGRFDVEKDDETILGLTALRELFDTCGRLVGLSDWRPSSPKRPGQYGRFTATIDRA